MQIYYRMLLFSEPQFIKLADDGERILIYMNEMVYSDNGDVRMVAHVAQVLYYRIAL